MPRQTSQVDGRSLAKLIQPTLPASALITRPRLFALLDRARDAPLVWLGAGPGSGKTTLIASYLPARRLSAFWMQLDEGDNDPATFFHYLGLGAQGAKRRRRARLPHLGPEHLAQLAVFARRFFQDLYQRLPARAAVVLDNFHALAADSVMHELVRVGAECLPPDLTMFVLSRSGPPATFARLIVEQRVAVIDEAPLRLTLAETARLLRRQSSRRAGVGAWVTAKQLFESTGGWLAGTVLMRKATTLVADGSRRATSSLPGDRQSAAISTPERLADYFDQEVLAQLDAQARRIVLATSPLPSMTAEMAEALSGEPTAGRVLARLHAAGQFTERRDERPLCFQYHSLFREFLVNRLAATVSRADLRRLQARAAKLLATDGQLESAVAMYVAADQPDAAAALVVAEAPSLLLEGRSQQLNSWISMLPAAVRNTAPWLQFWHGAASLGTQPLEAQQLFEGAFKAFELTGDKAGTVLACAGVMDALWYAWRDPAALDPWIVRMTALASDDDDLSPDLETVLACAMLSALFWRWPADTSSSRWAARAERALQTASEVDFRIGAAAVALANLYVCRGDLVSARRVRVTLEDVLRRGRASPFARLALVQTRALIATVQGDSDALAIAAEGLAFGAEHGVEFWNVPLLGVRCLAAQTCGDVQLAQHTIEHMHAQSREGPLHFRSWILSLQSWVEREAGDIYAARLAGEASLELAAKEGPLPEALARLALAQVNHDLGRLADADAHIARVAEIERGMGSPLLEIGWRLIAARFAFARGDELAGLSELREAFGRGAATGLVEWQGKLTRAELSALCAKALDARIEPKYARMLIRKRHLVPGPEAAQVEAWPWPIKIYTLGRFSLLRGGRPVVFSGKTQKRPLDLLKVLIAFGGRQVSQARIVEALWPDGDATGPSFDMALRRLRDLLGADAVTRTERKLTLNPRCCWVDLWTLERALKIEPGANGSADAISLYRGAFLSDHAESWCVAPRERVRAALVRYVRHNGEALERAGRWDDAAEWYERGLEADDLIELFYRRLMQCYVELDRRAEGLAVFRRCRRLLAAQLGITPSATTLALFRSISA